MLRCRSRLPNGPPAVVVQRTNATTAVNASSASTLNSSRCLAIVRNSAGGLLGALFGDGFVHLLNHIDELVSRIAIVGCQKIAMPGSVSTFEMSAILIVNVSPHPLTGDMHSMVSPSIR